MSRVSLGIFPVYRWQEDRRTLRVRLSESTSLYECPSCASSGFRARVVLEPDGDKGLREGPLALETCGCVETTAARASFTVAIYEFARDRPNLYDRMTMLHVDEEGRVDKPSSLVEGLSSRREGDEYVIAMPSSLAPGRDAAVLVQADLRPGNVYPRRWS